MACVIAPRKGCIVVINIINNIDRRGAIARRSVVLMDRGKGRLSGGKLLVPYGASIWEMIFRAWTKVK
jgi:hypothetical protein